MKAIQQKWFSSFEEFIDHKDEIRYYDVGDGAALAEYLIREEYVLVRSSRTVETYQLSLLW